MGGFGRGCTGKTLWVSGACRALVTWRQRNLDEEEQSRAVEFGFEVSSGPDEASIC